MGFNSGFKGLIPFHAYLPFFCKSNINDEFNLIFMDPCIVDDSVEIATRCSFVIEFIIPKFIEG